MTATSPQETSRLALYFGVWVVLFAATIMAYWAGLNGPFLFDDFGSIAALGDYGGITDWETFKLFVFGGSAGPTGRPLSLATFLIDANSWPADPWPFKRTNLIIHLLNGALVGVLTFQVVRISDAQPERARWIAFLSAGAWLLHPFLVSTTLYVVQRMAQLSTLFVLGGLVGYLYGRVRTETHASRAYLAMSASLGIGTVLATLSKENGALLPLLAGVLEITVVAANPRYRLRVNRGWLAIFVGLPAAAIFAYLASVIVRTDIFAVAPPRDFSLYERALTQPRILVDYLYHWFVPSLYTTGVFQDHFLKSTSLVAPISTLLAIVVQAGIVIVAVVKRHSWPLVSLAILFFYSGHLVESTVLNLELYFEHRNYLPAIFLYLPIIAFATGKLNRQQMVVVACGVLLLLGSFTRVSATIWQDFSMMVAASAEKAPTSARAQGQFAMDLFNAGKYEESLDVVDRALSNIPGGESLLLVARMNILCAGGRANTNQLRQTMSMLSSQYYDPRLIQVYTRLTAAVTQDQCPGIEAAELRSMFESMLEVPTNSNPRLLGYSQLQYFVGFTSVFLDDREAAMEAFSKSLESRPGAGHAMAMAALMATGDFYDEALELSDRALEQLNADPATGPLENRVSASDITGFQETVRGDRAAQQDDGT